MKSSSTPEEVINKALAEWVCGDRALCVTTALSRAGFTIIPAAHAGLSWGGFNLTGDRASINEVTRLMTVEERCKALETLIQRPLPHGVQADRPPCDECRARPRYDIFVLCQECLDKWAQGKAGEVDYHWRTIAEGKSNG